jgi:pimeloyl-ACP methyl ester carboxylesterase
MHSYGCQVGSDALCRLSTESRAAQGVRGGVSHLVYMSAYAVPEGTAMMDKVAEFGHNDLVPLAFDIDPEDKTRLNRNPKMLLVGDSDVPDAEVDDYLGTLVRWNGNAMYQPSKHAAWREVPVSYIFTTADMTVPIDYQKNFVDGMEKAGRHARTFELATGHCPNLTATQGVVAAINDIVGL